MKQLYEGLMRFDEHQQLAPALASNVSISDDGCTYTFSLREAYWSNNESISSYDFVRSIQELLSPQFPSDYASLLFPIKNAKQAKMGLCSMNEVGILAPNASTLIVSLEQRTPYFLELTAFPTYFPVHSTEKVYSGPFMLEQAQADYALTLVKNQIYWDKESVSLDTIHFSIISDETTEAYLFKRGELDWLGQPLSNAITNELLSQLKKEVFSYSIAGTCWLTFNTDLFPLNHVKVRQALALALNRQDIISHILQGGQQIATSPVPSLMHLHNEAYFLDGDLDKAKTLLAEACEELSIESLPTLTLTFPSSQRNRHLAQVIQQQLQQGLGITIHLELIETKLHRQKVKAGEFEIAYGQWIADYNDPIAFLELFTLPRSQGLNAANWLSEEYVTLIDRATIESDFKKRSLLLEGAESLLMSEMPIAPLYHYAFDYLKKDCIHGVILSPLGLADFKYAKKIYN
jgi:oligopeptide transport system substrate-binding protein